MDIVAAAIVAAAPAVKVAVDECALRRCVQSVRRAVARGELAYWDQGARTLTCEALDCARADGLTERVQRWAGNPDGVETLRMVRAGTPAPVDRVAVTRFNSGAAVYQNARGRCEDAPCCRCCS